VLKLRNLPDTPARALGEMMSLTIIIEIYDLGSQMRRDELMKPDMFSEVLLLIFGTAILMVLVSTLWLAVRF
jgi:hypothetical protein